MYIKDTSLIIEAMIKFSAYVQEADFKRNRVFREYISFTDQNCLLGREEDYKYEAAIIGRKALCVESWEEASIGTGKIAANAVKAIGQASNLVNYNQKIDFMNRLNPKHPEFRPEAERVLYDLYCGMDVKTAFNRAVKTFGAKYDTIAFLFFMKSYRQFLPISPGNFDRVFKSLGIDFSTAYRCEWDNYCTFIAIVQEIQDLMNCILPLDQEARLIDAHSFLWFINEERFIEWRPEAKISSIIEIQSEKQFAAAINQVPPKKRQYSYIFQRRASVVKEARQLANGVCQLCKKPAPFKDKNGDPYLEVHHVIWLSRGGADNLKNTVALCPNCHARMHIVDDEFDIDNLRSVADHYHSV